MVLMGRCISISLVSIITVVVFAVALLLGWLSTHDMPEAVFFATLIPLLQGQAPPSLVGHGKMTGVPAVPDDWQPQPRPERELFLNLPKTNNKNSIQSGDGGNEDDNDYYKMPQNGVGMCCRPTAYDDEMVRRTVLWYLLQGGRLIDTAHLYLNHRAIGVALQQAMQRGVPRSEIFVTTKVFPGTRYFGNATAAYQAVELYCQELQLDYIDLVLLHAPSNMFPKFLFPKTSSSTAIDHCKDLTNQQCRVETWKGLSQARDDGLVRSVGLSNFDAQQIAHLADLDLAPVAVHQMAYNPWAPDWAVETFDYCQKHGIAVTAYSSLGGLFSKSAAKTADTITSIARDKNKSAAQVMLRWALQKNAAVIPGTGNPKHMRENLDAYSFELSSEEMQRIDALRQDDLARKFFFMKMPSD